MKLNPKVCCKIQLAGTNHFLNVTTIGLFACRCLGYLHQVRSYGRSMSLTVLFASVPDFSDDGCTLMEEEFRPLSDAVFTWTSVGGQRVSGQTKVNQKAPIHSIIPINDMVHRPL